MVREEPKLGVCIQVIWAIGLTLKHHTLQRLISCSLSLSISFILLVLFPKRIPCGFGHSLQGVLGGWCEFAPEVSRCGVSCVFLASILPESVAAPHPCGSLHPCPLWPPGQGWNPPHALKVLSPSCSSQKVLPKLSSWFLAAGLPLHSLPPLGNGHSILPVALAKTTEASLDSFPSQATSKNPVSATFIILPVPKFYPSTAVSPVSTSAASPLDVS